MLNGQVQESYEYSPAQGGQVGNLTRKGGTLYTYGTQAGGCPAGALFKPHAVVAAGTSAFCYDPAGNQVRRMVGGATYELSYDAENRLGG